MEDNRIQGKLALITGASGGIGAACARQLAAKKVDLALCYSSNLANAERVAESIAAASESSGYQPKVTLHKTDLASPEQIAQLCVEVTVAHGRGVDILISNAGYGKRITDISDITLEEFDHMINVNLRAAYLLVKGIVPHMKTQKWGRIVFISSIAAIGGGINGCHYAASKAGLSGMMKNLAARLASFNISVNDVAPAMVGETGMLPSASSVPGILDEIPLKRLCTPEEVANAVSMFIETGFATGQSLLVTGGLR